MSKATFFDILGIDPQLSDRASPAAALWPNTLISLTQGLNTAPDAQPIVNLLERGLTFTNVRPGVDANAYFGVGSAGQLAFAADMTVGAQVTAQPFYLRAMPDMGIQLLATDPGYPAHVFFANDGRGHEVIIDSLPVKILLKEGLASALSSPPVSVGTFDLTAIDSFAYTLDDDVHPAEISCYVRLHLTTEGDLILEPAVPISLGPVQWMGLPARAVYDIQLLPSPNRRDYLEWTHNDIGSFISKPAAAGAIGFRSIELDFSKPPLSDLKNRLKDGAVNTDTLEVVLENVVIPVTVPILPIPSHGTFGFRRKITDKTDLGQAYSLSNAPVQIPIRRSGQQGGNGGTALVLQIEKFLFTTGDINAMDPADQPQAQLQAALIFQTTAGTTMGPTISVDDQWTLAAGMVMDLATTSVKFTIADTTIGLIGFKFGVSMGRLARHMHFKESFELLADLFITSKPSFSDTSPFKIRSLTGKDLSVAIHDIGYKLGRLSLDGLQMPDGMQLIFANTVNIILEEMGWVEEPNGTPYFSFSGGVSIGAGGGNSTRPSGTDKDNEGSGFGIRVRRLRFRLNEDDSQPFLKLDGVFLHLKYGEVIELDGFGYISDYTDSGWAIKEWGFGVKLKLNAMAMEFSLSAEFIKGNRTNLNDPTQRFGYFLAALELGFLPAGPIGLYDIRALVADNMAPNLDSTFPDGEGMALLRWHQLHDNALSMPANRTLADWLAELDAMAVGAGAGFSINGCGAAAHLSIFIFFAKSKADTGLLIIGELFLLENPKAIAFVAIEYDFDEDKFGVMAGVEINLADFTAGAMPAWLADIVRLTGTIYFGNKPWTFAIGQLADQSTWLSLKLEWDFWFVAKMMIGVGVQIVDGGPKAFGAVFTISAGSNWGIGAFILWGSFGLIIGTWKTGSNSSGLLFWIQLGFKINLFWVFSFGAEVSVRVTYLGKHPWYVTLHAEIKIDTPWYLPDVTFTIDRTYHECLPFDTSTITQSLQSSSALDATAQSALQLMIPGLAGALGDASFLYTFNQLNGLNGSRLGDTHLRQDIPIVSIDSTIVLNFSQPLSNDSMIASSTYDGTSDAGLQKVQDLSVRYGLKSIAVRRSPRFGPTAGTWTDFVTDAQTQLSIGGTAPEYLSFAWDKDSRADGKLAPKRLLINSSAPYSFITSAPQSDEEAMRNDAGYPCCDKRTDFQTAPKPHVLEFGKLALGARTSNIERFSGPNGAWWRWQLSQPPTVGVGDPNYPGQHVASASPRWSTLIGAADLADPAVVAHLEVAWDPMPGRLFFEAYEGTVLAAQQMVELSPAGSATLSLAMASATAARLSRLMVRVELPTPEIQTHASVMTAAATSFGSVGLPGIRILRILYVSLADAMHYVGRLHTCDNDGKLGAPGSDASGKLAFLPNHDYEVVVTTTIEAGAKDHGTRSLELSEALYFRTKGLPGLNACANVGDDIRRHVDETYPLRRAIPLYREEPCVLAFENSLSSVLPIDRAPGAGAPPEKAQMFPLELNIDRVASLDGLKRLTVPAADWIAAHRANPYPPRYYVSQPAFAYTAVRRGEVHDGFVLRHEAVRKAVPGCGIPQTDHASQVLLHQPIGPDGSSGLWEPSTGYRATVRQEGGPFTERSGFDIYDLGAFINQADGGAPATLWSVNASGALVAPPAAGGRFFASCGELDWNHLQVHTRLDLASANAAGIAVGVGAGTPVPQAILATVEIDGGGHALVLRVRDASGQRELGRAAVSISGDFLLNVIAFDDVVRASVGEVSVDGPRGAVREGRVALVADGPAQFAGIALAALDIYTFEFITSKFASFGEHLDSYDGSLPTMASGALGGTPVPLTAVLANHGAAIPAVMLGSADPQERQKLFDGVVSDLGLGLAKDTAAVSLTRLTDGSGTFGLLLESPEPLSVTRDVTINMTRHVRRWVPSSDPIVVPVGGILERTSPKPVVAPGPVEVGEAVLTPTVVDPLPVMATADALAEISFASTHVALAPALATFRPGDQVVRVIRRSGESLIEVYDAPMQPGPGGDLTGGLRGTLTIDQARQMSGFDSIVQLAPGAAAVIRGGGVIGTLGSGHWEDAEDPVPMVLLANGAENAILMLSKNATALPAGTYTLHFSMDRDRWTATTSSDPLQHYHSERSLVIKW